MIEQAPSRRRLNSPIQLLRALAVLAVIGFHYETSTLPMGYLGVDIFFVISGYVITKMIASSMLAGRFTFRNFYIRRFMRLAPASLLVILITSIPLVLFAASAAKQQAAWAGFTAIFAFENWNLILNPTSYFNPATDGRNPFIHFWSLAVEEQIYIVWPTIMWGIFALLNKKNRSAKKVTVSLAIVFLSFASFAYSLHAETTGGTGYYPTFARVWEFGVGAICFFVVDWLWPRLDSRTTRVRWALFLVATLLLLAELTLTFEPFERSRILATVVGCALTFTLIFLGHDSKIDDIFNHKIFTPLRKIGDWSYGIYLWHFPLMAIIPLTLGFSIYLREKLLLVSLSILLGYLSYKFVELPALASIQVAKKAKRLAVSSTGIALLLSFVLIVTSASAGSTSQKLDELWAIQKYKLEKCVELGLQQDTGIKSCFNFDSLSPSTTLARHDEFLIRTHNESCQVWVNSENVSRCEFGDISSPKSLTLIGDSHAAQWLPALNAIGVARHVKVITYLHSACPFSVEIVKSAGTAFLGCAEWIKKTLSHIEKSKTSLLLFAALSNWLVHATPQEMSAGFTRTFSLMHETTRAKIVVIRDTPFPLNAGFQSIPYCLEKTSIGMKCRMFRTQALQSDYMAKSALKAGAKVIDLSNQLCGKLWCNPTKGNVLMYRDESHISETAAFLMSDRLLQKLRNIGPQIFGDK